LGDIPIVASPESLLILKGMQDTSNSPLETDTAHVSMRQPKGEDGLYLESDRSCDYLCKDFYYTQPPSQELIEFLGRRPEQDSSKRAKKIDPGRCSCYEDLLLPFQVSACPVDHSIYGATAFLLRGETTVAYTGDFHLHGKGEQQTRDFVHQAKEAFLFITEGTRAGGGTSPEGRGNDWEGEVGGKGEGEEELEKTTEQSVCEACRESVDSSSGLVIADFSARNFERLESF
jgi:ribonuclease J